MRKFKSDEIKQIEAIAREVAEKIVNEAKAVKKSDKKETK